MSRRDFVISGCSLSRFCARESKYFHCQNYVLASLEITCMYGYFDTENAWLTRWKARAAHLNSCLIAQKSTLHNLRSRMFTHSCFLYVKNSNEHPTALQVLPTSVRSESPKAVNNGWTGTHHCCRVEHIIVGPTDVLMLLHINSFLRFSIVQKSRINDDAVLACKNDVVLPCQSQTLMKANQNQKETFWRKKWQSKLNLVCFEMAM